MVNFTTEKSSLRGTTRQEVLELSTGDVQSIVFGKPITNTISATPIAVYWQTQDTTIGQTPPTIGSGGIPTASPIPGSLYFIMPTFGDIQAGAGTNQLWLYTGQPTQFSNGWVLIFSQNISSNSGSGTGGGEGGGAGGN